MKDDHIPKCNCCDAKSTRFFIEILRGIGHVVLCNSCSLSFLKIDRDMILREVSFEEFVATQVIES